MTWSRVDENKYGFHCKTCGIKDEIKKDLEYPFLCKDCASLVMVRENYEEIEDKYL